MPTRDLIILMCVFVVVVFAVILFVFPEQAAKFRKKKKSEKGVSKKNWQKEALSLEKYVQSLKKEIEKWRNERQKILKDLALAKMRNKKLQDKIVQEREWIQREETTLEKKDSEINQLTKDTTKAQQELEHEYSLKLKAEREVANLKSDLDSIKEEKRQLSMKLIKSESELSRSLKECQEFKKSNAQLHKQNEEVSWVSKKEFERLEKLLQQKEKEIERLARNKEQ